MLNPSSAESTPANGNKGNELDEQRFACNLATIGRMAGNMQHPAHFGRVGRVFRRFSASETGQTRLYVVGELRLLPGKHGGDPLARLAVPQRGNGSLLRLAREHSGKFQSQFVGIVADENIRSKRDRNRALRVLAESQVRNAECQDKSSPPG